MPDVSESATFAIEEDGHEYDVTVPRETIAAAIAPAPLTSEAMAG